MGGQKKVFIADSDLHELENLAMCLYDAGWGISTYQTGEELVADLNSDEACCVVADADMPGVPACHLLELLSKRKHYLPAVFVANAPSATTIVQAMKAGAIDFLLKPCGDDILLEAVRTAAHYHELALMDYYTCASIQSRFQTLTRREQEIFRFVVTGMLNKQVASELGISEKTVKVHRGRMMRKLAVESVADLVRLSEKLTPIVRAPALTKSIGTDWCPASAMVTEMCSSNG